MASTSVGVKTYTESPTLLQYQAKVEVGEDTSYTTKKRQIPEIESNPSLNETLNAIFLPKEWVENGKKFIQYVSPEPGTREKARDLFKALDEKIKEREAREKGICPVREELYSQCFDEIIRQVTIECPERGLLLLKVRDEIKNTISSYKTLYESAILFGIRKQLEAEVGKEKIRKEIDELERKKVELINKKNELDKINFNKEFIKNLNNLSNKTKSEKTITFVNELNKSLPNSNQPQNSGVSIQNSNIFVKTMHKSKGRKAKNADNSNSDSKHTKYSADNMMRKIKNKVIESSRLLINKVLRDEIDSNKNIKIRMIMKKLKDIKI